MGKTGRVKSGGKRGFRVGKMVKVKIVKKGRFKGGEKEGRLRVGKKGEV